MDARRSDDPLIVAARQLVEHLASDTVFVKQVADEEINRRVAAGLLIPTDRLQLAPGLTLAPTGRIEALEDLLRSVLEETEGIPQPLIDKATGLLDDGAALVAPVDETDSPDVEEEPALPGAPAPVPEPEAAADPAPAPDEPEADAEAPTEKRASRKIPTEPAPCTDCDAELDLDQTRASVIRFRIPLCRPCMANH